MRGAMKESGVEWIGEIPEGWDLTKISQIYRQRNQKVSDKEYLPLSVTKNGIVPQLESAAKTEHTDDRRLVKINDFVINSRSDRRGSCGISSYDGSVSVINTVLEPFGELNGLYYNYVFKSAQFADEFYRLGHGIVDDLWSTKWGEMKRIYIPHPSTSDQHHIASFLDTKCSLIDSTIQKEREIIDKLKEYRQAVITEAVTKGIRAGVPMKDSGVEWIGEIPYTWSLHKLSFLCRSIGDVDHKMPESTDVGIPYVSPRDFYGVNNIDFDNAKKITEKSYLEMSKKMAPELHDIIFSRYASLGEIRYVVTTERFLVSYSCVIIKPNYEMTYPKYLYYYLHSDNIVQEISYYSNANTQANVGIDSINRFKVIIPNVKEQREIVDYLDAKCSAIDATIQKRELAIEKLTAYKQSLIYECVTGKREVLA